MIKLNRNKTILKLVQCGYCGTEIVEGEDFCKKCVEGYKIDNKKNKYMASDCPLAGKHLNQLSKDTEIRHDEALHPIEIMAKAYKL